MTVKTTTLILLLLLTGFGLEAQMPPNLRPVPQRPSATTVNPAVFAATNLPVAPPVFPSLPAPGPSAASPAPAAAAEQMVPAGDINFQGVDVDQVLDVYARYVGRTLLRAGLPRRRLCSIRRHP